MVFQEVAQVQQLDQGPSLVVSRGVEVVPLFLFRHAFDDRGRPWAGQELSAPNAQSGWVSLDAA